MSKDLTAVDISQRIHFIRGHRVMLDSDLAGLYEVSAKRLNEQVRRNLVRFPEDFMFQLSHGEYEVLRSQFATLDVGRGKYRKYLPYVFTEQGVAMLSSVLNSDRAVQVNIAIMRAFVKLREMLEENKDLAKIIDRLERKFLKHDRQFKIVFEAIRQLMAVGSPVVQRTIKSLGDK